MVFLRQKSEKCTQILYYWVLFLLEENVNLPKYSEILFEGNNIFFGLTGGKGLANILHFYMHIFAILKNYKNPIKLWIWVIYDKNRKGI